MYMNKTRLFLHVSITKCAVSALCARDMVTIGSVVLIVLFVYFINLQRACAGVGSVCVCLSVFCILSITCN